MGLRWNRLLLAGVVDVLIGIGWMNYRSANEPATSRRFVMIQRLRDTRDVDAVGVGDPTTRAGASTVIDELLVCPRKKRS